MIYDMHIANFIINLWALNNYNFHLRALKGRKYVFSTFYKNDTMYKQMPATSPQKYVLFSLKIQQSCYPHKVTLAAHSTIWLPS